MSYNKMMKWNKKHRKGTKQPIIMSTGSGFWPSGAFIEEWIEYTKVQKTRGMTFLSCEEYYKAQLK
jgi:hypothetical protein